jgi:hypothetical protein
MVFVLSLNLSEDLNYYFDLSFKGVSAEDQQNMLLMFVFISLFNYLTVRIIKALKYRKIYDYI